MIRTAALLLACAALGACATVQVPAFYRSDDMSPSAVPGSVLRTERMRDPADGMRALRVLHTTTGLDGRPRTVSSVVFFPAGAPPANGRPVVAWAHPTTGVAEYCAPSLRQDFYTTVQGLQGFLARGFVVVATDYPGLGTVGPHPYLVGVSEARAVLDSVRAARNVREVGAGDRYAVWGHSQGGQAVLFAGEIAATYARELTLLGIAAAAPATELGALFRDDIGTPLGRVLTAYALWSWSRVYDDSVTRVLAPGALAPMDKLAADCAESMIQGIELAVDSRPLAQAFLAQDPTTVEPWRGIIERNTPGQRPAGAPLFITQGSADPLVKPAVTQGFARTLCQRGEKVRLSIMPGVTHNPAGRAAAPAAVEWIAARFAGAPAPNDCAALLR